MASEVPVPLNFGQHLLKLSRFNDFVLTVSGDVELKGNSMILSFNGPVIMDLVSQQGCMAVDFEEFGEDTVRAVLLACYTGTATITGENFREINKIAIALKIEWLRKCCLKQFRKICKAAKTEDELQWLFLEAEYVVREANDCSLAEALSSSLSSETRSALMKKLAPNLSNSSVSTATTCLTISLTDTFSALVESLKGRKKDAGKLQTTVTDRRILTIDNLVAYRTSDPTGFEALVSLLDDSEDEQIMIHLWKVYRNKNLALSQGQQYIGGDLVLNSVFLDGGKYLNGKETHKPNEAESLIERLLADDRVRNYNMFIDAIAFCEFYNSIKRYERDPSGNNAVYVGTRGSDHWLINHPIIPNQRITSLLRKAADKLGRPHILPIFSQNLQKISLTVLGAFMAADNIITNKLYPFEIGSEVFVDHLVRERKYNFLMSTNEDNTCKLGPGACWIGTHFMLSEETPLTVNFIDDQSDAKKLEPPGHYHYNDLDRIHFYLEPRFQNGNDDTTTMLIPLSWWPGNWQLFQGIFGKHYTYSRKDNKPISQQDLTVDLVMYYSILR